MKREEALDLLGEYAVNKRTGNIIEPRVNALIDFALTNEGEIEIEVNNNWSTPPNPKGVKKFVRLGGTTYKYQVWGVIR